MRKSCNRKPRGVSIPIMVARHSCADEVEMQERMLIESFAGGWADTRSYDGLANMRNVLMMAAAHKKDKSALAICDAMRILTANMRDRHEKTGRMGVTGEEMKMLHVFADVYRDFWSRQTMNLFRACCIAANVALEQQEAA
jgi:hypothetical protein